MLFHPSMSALFLARHPGLHTLWFCPLPGSKLGSRSTHPCVGLVVVPRRSSRRPRVSSTSFVIIICRYHFVASSCVRWSFRRRVSPSRVGRFPRPRVVFPPSRPSPSLSSSSVRCGRQSTSVVVWTLLPASVRRRLRRRRLVVVVAVACCVVVVVVVVVLVVARRPRNA